MNNKPEDMPAFPNTQKTMLSATCSCGKRVDFNDITHSGMTLRDYFAGQALIAMGMMTGSSLNISASRAYQLADAMLSARLNTKGE